VRVSNLHEKSAVHNKQISQSQSHYALTLTFSWNIILVLIGKHTLDYLDAH